MVAQALSLGVSDFRALREKDLLYIDKSGLIVEMLDLAGAQVLLLPRPRRFGKTLNLSMLRCFFERSKDDLSALFEGLAIWNAGEKYRAHFQRYPVLFLTFRDVKAPTYEACWGQIKNKIIALFAEHSALLSSGVLHEHEARDFQAVLDGTAEEVLYGQALGDLSKYLRKATGERVMIFIDEYDEPIHAGYVDRDGNGYGKQILDFFRRFLTVGLKDNPDLERGVVTGILRISRESIFSGLNNLIVYTLLDHSFSTCFGFTEPEIAALLDQTGHTDKLEEVRTWYNGYVFGNNVIYNPWSVLNFLSKGGSARPYWLNTSSNDLIKTQISARATSLQETFETLIEGGSIEKMLDENVALEQIETSDDVLWSLLVFSGYLKAEEVPDSDKDFAPQYRLSIPNREVRSLYTSTFREWLFASLRQGHRGNLEVLLRALLQGDAQGLEKQLGAFVKNLLSFHDLDPDEPERIYQAFLLGLCAAVEPGHRVRSNRESGKGRPDVLILPAKPGNPGIVLELKVARKKSLSAALAEGLEQVRTKDYEAELRAVGATPIHVFVCAFDGKDLRVVSGADAPTPLGSGPEV